MPLEPQILALAREWGTPPWEIEEKMTAKWWYWMAEIGRK